MKAFQICIKGLCLIGLYPSLFKMGSDNKYPATFCFTIFDILRWRLCRASNVNIPYVSGITILILNLECSKNDSLFNRDGAESLPLAARTKPCVSLHTSSLSIISCLPILWAFFLTSVILTISRLSLSTTSQILSIRTRYLKAGPCYCNYVPRQDIFSHSGMSQQ